MPSKKGLRLVSFQEGVQHPFGRTTKSFLGLRNLGHFHCSPTLFSTTSTLYQQVISWIKKPLSHFHGSPTLFSTTSTPSLWLLFFCSVVSYFQEAQSYGPIFSKSGQNKVLFARPSILISQLISIQTLIISLILQHQNIVIFISKKFSFNV